MQFYYKLLKLMKNMKSETNSVLGADDQQSILSIVSSFMVRLTTSGKKFVLNLSKQQ